MRVRGTLAISLLAALAMLYASAPAPLLLAQSGQSSSQPQSGIGEQDKMAVYQGQQVDAIRFPNLANPADQKRMRQLIAQKENIPLKRDLIRESIHQLFDSGRFADVRVEAERGTTGGVTLDIFTVPNYFVGKIRVESSLGRPTPGQVANASRLNLGDLFTSDALDKAQANIRRLMEENGYYHSSITPEQQRNETNQQVDILFRITPGLQARVGKVTAKCDPGCSENEIEKVAKLRPGDPVSLQRASNALDRLRQQYQKQDRLLAQVSIATKTYRSEANAVDYVLEITPGPKVVILADGFKIKRKILKQNVPVFEENAVDEDLLNEGRRNLLNYMQTHGYFEAKIGIKKESDAPQNRLRIIYVIDPGTRRKLDVVEITGNKYFPTDELRSRMQVQPAARFSRIGRYNEALLAGDVRTLEGLYRANGFQQVNITSKLTEGYAGHENELAITLTVEEGPQTRVGKFRIIGNKAFSEAQLHVGVIQTAVGQPFSEVYIAEDRDNLLNYYYNHGFPHASFEAAANPIPGQENRMDVTFTVHEGEQVFVGKVLVTGLQYTRPYIVQRELQVKSGDPLSQLDMLQSQQRLYDLGIFSQVDTAVQNPNGNLSEKNVLFDIQEAKRWSLSLRCRTRISNRTA